jgi:hypothetical protein
MSAPPTSLAALPSPLVACSVASRLRKDHAEAQDLGLTPSSQLRYLPDYAKIAREALGQAEPARKSLKETALDADNGS